MALIARPDEEVDRRVDATRQLLPVADDPVGELARREPLLRRYARHLVGMLVHARQEEGLRPALALVSNEDVADDGRVRVPDVRRRVHVVDRRCQVVAHRYP